MHLKPNNVAELTKTVEERVLPLLRKQEGFKDELVFVSTDGSQVIAISLWDRKEHAESYGSKTYPQVLQTLGSLLEGTPQVKTYDVTNSTFHKVGARVTA